MDAIVLSWRELLTAILLATLVYLLEVALFSRRRICKGRGKAPGHEGEACSEVARLREELVQLRQRLDALEAQRESARSDGTAADTPYGHAVRLARQGVNAQELASSCGISRGEAELIIALNRGEG